MNSFYVIVPSNTPGFPENKTNKYKVHLPKKLTFDGPGWVVGLAGIIYPNSWATIGTVEKQYLIAHLNDGRKYRFPVPRGSFLSPKQLEHGIYYGMLTELETLMHPGQPTSRKRRAVQTEEEGELGVPQPMDEADEVPMLPAQRKAEEERKRQDQRRAQEERARLEQERLAKEGRYKTEEERVQEHNKRVAEAVKRREKEEDDRKAAEAERLRKEEDQRKANEKKAQEEKQRKADEEKQRKADDEKQRKPDEEKQRKADDEKQRKADDEKQRKADEEKQRKADEENQRKANEKKAKEEKQRFDEAERTRIQQEQEILEYEKKTEEDAARKVEEDEDRWAHEEEEKRETMKSLPDHEFYGHYLIQLVKGKDPYPELHYLDERDPFIFGKTFKKYVEKYNLRWDPETRLFVDFLDHVQKHIPEFKAMFEKEEYNENYANKSEAEKQEILEIARAIQFFFLEDIARFSLRIVDSKISHVTLTDQVGYVLGYDKNHPIKNGQIAKYMADLHGGVSHLCIYLNSGLIESMIIGNTFANLLQVIAVEGKVGEVIEKNFSAPIFHKIIAKDMDVIDVEIRSLTGREVPFDFGQVILTLQFKKTIVF